MLTTETVDNPDHAGEKILKVKVAMPDGTEKGVEVVYNENSANPEAGIADALKALANNLKVE